MFQVVQNQSFVIHPLRVHDNFQVLGIDAGNTFGILIYGYTRYGGREFPFADVVVNRVSARFFRAPLNKIDIGHYLVDGI